MTILTTARSLYQPYLVKVVIPDNLNINVPSSVTPAPTFPAKYAIETNPEFYIGAIIIMDTLNYQFWDYVDGKMVRYENDGLVGSAAMGDCFWNAWQSSIPEEHRNGTDGRSALKATIDRFLNLLLEVGVEGIFGDIPDAKSRKNILLEVLDYESVIKCVDFIRPRLDAETFLGYPAAIELAETFPLGYNELFLKKAQLTLMLISTEYRYRNPGAPNNLKVTIAADYQIPRILRAMGILKYSDDLAKMVDNQQLIQPGSPEELAIRAATVLAGEALSDQYGLPVAQLDYWLWCHRKAWPEQNFHLTLTTNY